MKCYKCGQSLPDDSNFCHYCGADLSEGLHCSSCGTLLPEGVKFCHKCGSTVNHRSKDIDDNPNTAQSKPDCFERWCTDFLEKLAQNPTLLQELSKELPVDTSDDQPYTTEFAAMLDRWYASTPNQCNRVADSQKTCSNARRVSLLEPDSAVDTATQIRLMVNDTQRELATGISQQIADFRAKYKFEQADALLTLSQQYLSQLYSLEDWAAEYNLTVAQFSATVAQWKREFADGVNTALLGSPPKEKS